MTKIVNGREEFVPKRFRIKRENLEKFGFATGCPGRRAANRGSSAVGHSEECRTRFAEKLKKLGVDRITREVENLLEYLTEEENRMKRRCAERRPLGLGARRRRRPVG